MVKDHDTILALLAVGSRALSDPLLSADEKYNVLCSSLFFLKHYGFKGWMNYHKSLNNNLSCVLNIIKFYEDQDELLKLKHDKMYYNCTKQII